MPAKPVVDVRLAKKHVTQPKQVAVSPQPTQRATLRVPIASGDQVKRKRIKLFKKAPAARSRRRQQAFNYASVGLMLFSMLYGVQAYQLNQRLKEELATVLGAQSGTQEVVNENGQAASGAIAVNDQPDEEPVSEDQIAAYQVAPDQPRYLKIPKFNIKARVVTVGKTADGSVDVPGSVHDVGWYSESRSINAESGAAFLVGHVSGLTNTGVFYNINKLRPGDEIIIERGDGKEIAFTVFSQNAYDVSNVDMRRALSTSPSHTDKLNLNLMTCSGGFDPTSQTYDQRLLVSAHKT